MDNHRLKLGNCDKQIIMFNQVTIVNYDDPQFILHMVVLQHIF